MLANFKTVHGRGRSHLRVVAQHDIYKLSRLLSHQRVETNDVEKILRAKFHRLHNIELFTKHKTLYLRVSYFQPCDPARYQHHLNTLTQKINEWECGMSFRNMIDACHYPDFIFDPSSGDVIDLPCDVNLDIPIDIWNT